MIIKYWMLGPVNSQPLLSHFYLFDYQLFMIYKAMRRREVQYLS